MPTTLERICQITEGKGFGYSKHPMGQDIRIPFGTEDGTELSIIIHVMRSAGLPGDGGPEKARDITVVCFRIYGLLKAGTENRDRLMARLLDLNYSDFAEYSLNSSDGDVKVSVNVIVEDQEFTAAQFDQAMRTLISSTFENRDELIRINGGADAGLRQDEPVSIPKTPSGESMEDPIVLSSMSESDGVNQEYRFLEDIYGKIGRDWQLTAQSLVSESGRHYDQMSVSLKDGTEKTIWFDITAFFGQ